LYKYLQKVMKFVHVGHKVRIDPAKEM